MVRILIYSLVVMICLPINVHAETNAPTDEQREVAAEKLNAAVAAAQDWLAIVDNRKYRESWDQAAKFFQNKVPRDQWESSLKQVRSSYGKVISREVTNLQYTTYMPGVPPGEFAIIQFRAKFEDREAVETITPMMEDGVWRVSGYYMR